MTLLQASETDFQNLVIELAQLRGWLVFHARPSQTGGRWSTAMQGQPGFPDLVLARRGEVLHVELKSEKGRLTEWQKMWLEALDGECWRPSDWDQIQTRLA